MLRQALVLTWKALLFRTPLRVLFCSHIVWSSLHFSRTGVSLLSSFYEPERSTTFQRAYITSLHPYPIHFGPENGSSMLLQKHWYPYTVLHVVKSQETKSDFFPFKRKLRFIVNYETFCILNVFAVVSSSEHDVGCVWTWPHIAATNLSKVSVHSLKWCTLFKVWNNVL
jgi:hypothetical protein